MGSGLSWHRLVILMEYQFNDGGRTVAGFKGQTGDCGVRAVAIVTGLPYKEVYDAINMISKQEKPVRGLRSSNARTGIWPNTLSTFLEQYGFKWTPTMRFGSGCTVHLRKNELPSGKIVARVSKHFCAIVDGVIQDLADPSRNGTRCVYGYWSKESS